MAEVGQRLGSGAYRLSALRNSPSRPVCTGESPGSLLVSCTFSDNRVKEESTRDQREVQPVSRSRATSDKLSKVRRNEKLLPGRMTSWIRGPVSIHPDAFRSPQQLRAFCTVIFILSEQGSERLRRLKLHPDTLQALSRGYRWRSGSSSSKDAPVLYRSRTSYYDVLKVTPGATQSQIKTAYYKQSFIYHPDKNPGNEEATQRFSEISEAYTVLGSISLRKRYDRGLLSRSDVQSAGRPSSKETTSKGSPPQQQQFRARRFSQAGGKTMFDFDAFYQAHYGEQLQKEREMRARKQRMEEQQKEEYKKWKQARTMDMTVAVLLAMAGLFFVNVIKP
ncbi:dnaJ (Hsp40) homolog, subfamily C, member 30b [Sebastes umbrosus]|uniref:dnaJ (Hsp40) homolog, subfamily C, member 30b n=1 Tax=Sebastes umbrosus TaxID=72105 RepID=UPI00189EA6C3|nr:dnaJ (Hsp40) homolog, subfamily C, member 30b [Sebastes umbrosus]